MLPSWVMRLMALIFGAVGWLCQVVGYHGLYLEGYVDSGSFFLFAMRSMMISSSSLWALLWAILMVFFVFSNMLLHLALSSLDCNTTLPLKSGWMWCLTYVGYFFLSPKTTGLHFFSQL